VISIGIATFLTLYYIIALIYFKSIGIFNINYIQYKIISKGTSAIHLIGILGIILGIIGGVKNIVTKSNKSLSILAIVLNIIGTSMMIDILFSIDGPMAAKPVIYIYPQTRQETTIQLFYNGKLNVTYPNYNNLINGWKVTAYPDGKVINDADGKEYSYLFWEGTPNKQKYDLSKGFVVEGKDTAEFLQDKLSKLGLTPKEYNEFIVYWLPKMQDNKYNLIHFAGKEYTDTAKLEITPKPDSMLRVFMVFKPLNEKIIIEPQEIKSFTRKGFSVVEWGGSELDN
jgi:hypothetical protein